RRADGGEVVWQTTDLPDYAQIDLVGRPLLAQGKLFIAGKSQANAMQQVVLAIQPHDGKLLWKAEVGTFRQGQQMHYYYGMRDSAPQPRLVYRAGSIYVDTHVGVLARLDADSGALDWGYGYETDPAQAGYMRFAMIVEYGQPRPASTVSSEPLQLGESLLIKGMQSGHLCCIEPNRMKVLWDRPIAQPPRL